MQLITLGMNMKRLPLAFIILCICAAGLSHCKKSAMEGHFIIVTQDNLKIRFGASISPDTKSETAARFSRLDLYGLKENMGFSLREEAKIPIMI